MRPVTTRIENDRKIRTILDVIGKPKAESLPLFNTYTDNTTRTVNGTPTNDQDSGDFHPEGM